MECSVNGHCSRLRNSSTERMRARMERSITQSRDSKADARASNEELAHHVLQSTINCGVTEFCICPGGRNAPLLACLETQDFLTCFWGFEERSTAFFALG